MDVVTLGMANANAKKNYSPQWSVISSRPQKMGDSSTVPATTGQTARLSEVAPFAVKSVRLVYANWMNLTGTSAEYPNYCGVRVKSAVHKAGTSAPNRVATDPLFRVAFGGREYGYCASGAVLITDPIPVSVLAGERWWHESYVDCFLGAGPATPTLSLVAGTGLGVGITFYVVTTYVYADGTESLPSVEASIATTSGNEQIKVTSPAVVPGIIGYRAYYGSSAGGFKTENPVYPMAPLGTDITLASSSATNGLNRTIRTLTNVGYPIGKGLLDGVGDASVAGRDYTDGPLVFTGAGGYGGVFGPIAVLGLATDGLLHRSVALLGDSIQAGTGDRGYGGSFGGSGFRALANQTAQIIFDPAQTPKMGFLSLAQGGETYAQFASEAGGSRRRYVSEHATTILNNYGTNDLGSGSAPLYASELSTLKYYAGRKKYFRLTLDPRTATTDGYKTIANQTMSSTDIEADRRAFNNCIKGATGAVTVTAEALFRSAGTAVPADNLYSGGNGTATKFFTAYPFRQGTEVVKVNGTTKALTTDYTYRGTATINGIAYASGITFVAAPANAATVTMDYTKIESFGALTGYSGYFDTSAAVEVNAAGAAGTNGGWWKPAQAGVGITGTATGNTSTVLTDTSKSWTVDQWRGMAVRITADAGTPAAVGLANDIQSNTATTLKTGNAWATTPSATASYEIFNPYVIDAIHATSQGHLEKSLLIDVTKF